MNDAPILSDDDPYSMPSMPTMPGGDPNALGRIDHYDLLRKLGGGGFGVVYLARDTASGVEVAIKTLHPLIKRNAEEMDLLREKFALVSRLAHPNIATALVLHPVRDIHVWDDAARAELKLSPGDSVMVMRYAPGVTLSRWRRQFPDGVVPPDFALEIGRQVAAALDYAHGERIVHRDIKPGNIMVETLEGGRVRARILDFGLAAEIRSSMSRVSTEQGDTSGTRPYMAPEQWLGNKQDGRTDQYALACVLYELLSGAPPFAGVFETGDLGIMLQTVRDIPAENLVGVPGAINRAFAKALAKSPNARFSNCAEFVSSMKGRGASFSAVDGRRRRSMRENARSLVAKFRIAFLNHPKVALSLLVAVLVFSIGVRLRPALEGEKQPVVEPKVPVSTPSVLSTNAKPESNTLNYNPADIAVFIDGEPAVLKSEVDEAVRAQLDRTGSQSGSETSSEDADQIRRNVARQLADKHLILRDLHAKGVKATDKDRAEFFKTALNGETDIAAIAARFGMPVERVRRDIEDQILLQVKFREFEKAAPAENSITESQIKARFEEGLKTRPSLTNAVPEQVRASHILVKVDKAEDDAAALEKIKNLRKRALAGEDFGALARENSDCPSKAKGGDLGTFGRGAMVPEFDKAAFEQPVGEIGKVVKTSFGYHIIKVTEKIPAHIPTIKDFRPQIIESIRAEAVMKTQRKYIEGLRNAANLDFSSDYDPSHTESAGVAEFAEAAEARSPRPSQGTAEAMRLENASFHAAGERYIATIAGISVPLRWCPPGSFKMGSDNGDSDERPMLHVTVPKGFWMGETELPQMLWREVMGDEIKPHNGTSGLHPMGNISWNDCVQFVKKINERADVISAGLHFAIPTEAQWEYACRAEGTGDYGRTKDRGEGRLQDMGWYSLNSGAVTHSATEPRTPNAWGLLNMHGNVWEWCANAWQNHPDGNLDNDAALQASGHTRVLRGGCCNSNARTCRSAFRAGIGQSERLPGYGLRLLAFQDEN